MQVPYKCGAFGWIIVKYNDLKNVTMSDLFIDKNDVNVIW